MTSFVDHAAFQVSDLEWHLNLFDKAYNMQPYRTVVTESGCRNMWLVGGIQLNEVPGFEAGKGGSFHHLCLIVDDLEAARAKALECGCAEMPKHHWVKTPFGLEIEMFQAPAESIDTMRKVPKRV